MRAKRVQPYILTLSYHCLAVLHCPGCHLTQYYMPEFRKALCQSNGLAWFVCDMSVKGFLLIYTFISQIQD